MAPPTEEVMGGFRRILVRLDAPTRREYCAAALQEELTSVRERLRACAAALAQARQVEDATKQLEASVPGGGGARVASASVQALLAQLEALHRRLSASFPTLGDAPEAPAKRRRKASAADEDAEDDNKPGGGKRARTDARALIHELEALLEAAPAGGAAAGKAVELVRRFLALLPVQPERHAGFWRERLEQRVVLPVVRRLWLPKDVAPALERHREHVAWLGDALEAAGRTRPYLQSVCSELIAETKALLAKRERRDARRKEKGEADSSKSKKRRVVSEESAAVAVTTPSASTRTAQMQIHEVRAALARCAREVRQASDREFELSAFDASLKRLVDVVGAVSRAFSFADCAALTGALFAMVEQVERVADVERRCDRLMCLEELLKLLIDRADVPLSSRHRASAKEYLQNCQQSIQLLSTDRANDHAAVAGNEGDADARLKPAKEKPAASSTAAGDSKHLRFE